MYTTNSEIPIDLRKQMAALFEVLAKFDENDRYCRKILLYLCVTHPTKHGFNELRRRLNDIEDGPTFSRKTLFNHLNHLLDLEVITFKIVKESNLPIKPKKYYLNPDFVKIAKDIFVHDYDLLLLDFHEDFKEVDVNSLTIALIDIMLSDIFTLLVDNIIYSEKISDYKRQRISVRFELLTKGYRRRVIELQEEEDAISMIKNVVKIWRGFRDENWGSLLDPLIKREILVRK